MIFFLFFFLSSDIWVFVFCWIFDSTFQAKKSKKLKPGQNPIRQRLGKGILNTCAIFQGLSHKAAWTFGLLCGKVQMTAWHRNYLVLVFIFDFMLDVHDDLDLDSEKMMMLMMPPSTRYQYYL